MKYIAFIAGMLLTAVTWAGTNSGGVATRVTPPGPTGYVVGNLIKSSEINGEYNDIYTELTDRVSRSGKGSMLANWNMNSHKLTGLLAGTVAGDSVEYSQVAAKANAGANTDITSLNGPALGAASATAFTASTVAATTSATSPVINTSQGADIASATTLDLDAASGQYVTVTGTTSITSITLSQGRIRYVKFAGALTLTNSANLVLAGSANVITAANDVAVFIGESAGVVRCISYVFASNPLTPQATRQGVISKNLADATGTLVVSGLGFLPRLIKFTALGPSGYASSSFGVYDRTAGTNTLVRHTPTTSATATALSIVLSATDADEQRSVVSATSFGQFTISWTKLGTPTGTGVVMWEAFG